MEQRIGRNHSVTNVQSSPPGEDPAYAKLRIPPHSVEAESSVLGGLLLDNGAWDRVGDLLTDGDFYRYEHRLVYSAVGKLVNETKPADVITVYEELQRQGKGDEIGGLVYLNALAQYVPSASNIRRYAEIVRERSILRKLVSCQRRDRDQRLQPARAGRWTRFWTRPSRQDLQDRRRGLAHEAGLPGHGMAWSCNCSTACKRWPTTRTM
jgi:hypothetical protein